MHYHFFDYREDDNHIKSQLQYLYIYNGNLYDYTVSSFNILIIILKKWKI